MLEKKLKFSVLVETVIKALKQAAEMKHKLSACILIPTLARYSTAKVGNKMHACIQFMFHLSCLFYCSSY